MPYYAVWLLMSSLCLQIALAPGMNRSWNSMLCESGEDDSESREQPTEEELAELLSLPSLRSVRSVFVPHIAWIAAVSVGGPNFGGSVPPSIANAELACRNGIGGPLRC